MSRKTTPVIRRTARLTFDALVASIRAVDEQLAVQAGRAVNVTLTLRNWLIGCRIAEYELKGADRAKYGEQLLDKLSLKLESLGVSACGRRQLYQYLRFYETYPQIVRSVTAQFRPLLSDNLEPFSHENIGQLNTYVTWYRRHMMQKSDNAPIGLLLCAQKDHALAEYALAGMDNKLFVSKYQLHLPKPAQLRRRLERAIQEGTP